MKQMEVEEVEQMEKMKKVVGVKQVEEVEEYGVKSDIRYLPDCTKLSLEDYLNKSEGVYMFKRFP